jgi:hypothetical protein
MCVVSYVGDQWRTRWPETQPGIAPNYPNISPTGPTKSEFDALKAEVEALRKLLKAAKIYDKATGQSDCEMDDKVSFIKEVAKVVGVDMSKVFK